MIPKYQSHKYLSLMLIGILVVMIIALAACIDYYDLSTSVSPSGAGIVTPGGGTYEPGSEVNLNAYANSGYVFDHWGGNASGYSSSTSATMNSDKSVIAYFEKLSYGLSTAVSPSGAGSISPSGGTYEAGSTVSLIAQPSSRYEFDRWEADASGYSRSISTTMNSDKHIIAVFAYTNKPPNTPSVPSGKSEAYTGTSYSCSTSATDPDDDRVKYTFDWGDGSTSETGFLSSGETAKNSHSWSSPGIYYVRAKATDSNGASSGWSSFKMVTVSVRYRFNVPRWDETSLLKDMSTGETVKGSFSIGGVGSDILVNVEGPTGDLVPYSVFVADGHLEFEAAQPGIYRICFRNVGPPGGFSGAYCKLITLKMNSAGWQTS
jgi:hypothetical protein